MKRTASISTWIKQLLKADPPRAKSLVVTIFGDAIAPHGDSIWLQSLIDLLRPFEVNERLVRSSVFRLVEEEWLVAERHGRQSRYGFTAPGRKRFERAHDRIYFAAEHRWNHEWTLLLAPPAQLPAGCRTTLRRELAWEGFRAIAPGVFLHPAGDVRALEEILGRARVRDRVTLCSARETALGIAQPLHSLIAQHWDLRSVVRGYRAFIRRFGALLEKMPREGRIPPEQAFVIRTLVIHAFRRALLHDPRLPAELLPEDWPGRTAYDLCRSVYQLSYRDSERYMRSILGASAGRPASYFEDRFGGLTGDEPRDAIQIRA